MDLLSMPSKSSPALQNLLCEIELICSHPASVAQVCKADNLSGLENKHTGLIRA